jgi:hypothetical protein
VLADGTIRYVRRGGSPKPDQFTYAVTDGSSESVATVTITATR